MALRQFLLVWAAISAVGGGLAALIAWWVSCGSGLGFLVGYLLIQPVAMLNLYFVTILTKPHGDTHD